MHAYSIEFITSVVEAALFASGRSLTLEELVELFAAEEQDADAAKQLKNAIRKSVREALTRLEESCETRGVELIEVASGFRFQVKMDYAGHVRHLWAVRPARQSRAMLETLALIAYRQPITRTEIESIRGVTVSPQIMNTLLEYGWIRMVGHRETPGRPRLYGTTRQFLDQFGLKGLDDLPSLIELKEIAEQNTQLMLDLANSPDPIEDPEQEQDNQVQTSEDEPDNASDDTETMPESEPEPEPEP
ncbi:MAG: SMC-Scp complex subunit ScpB, partial [Pseudomonadota bacterium]